MYPHKINSILYTRRFLIGSINNSQKHRIIGLLKGKSFFWGILIFLTFLYGVYFQSKTLINHDVAWYIYGAEQILEGARLYREIIEVNPPLNFYITIIPVSIAKLFNLPSTAVYKCFIFLIGWASLVICLFILKKYFDKDKSSLRWFLAFVLSLIFFAYPMVHFAQREHIMVMLCLPYILSSILFIQKKKLNLNIRLFISLAAFTGFALKPFFLLSWITTEFFIIFYTKKIKTPFSRVENYIITAGMVIYYILVNTVWTDYFIITKMALQVYHSYNTPLNIILLFRYTYVLALLFACFAFFMSKKNKADLLSKLILFQMAALIVVGFMQHKGWPYHFIPYWCVTIFFWCAYIGSSLANNGQLKKQLKLGADGVMLIIAVYCLIFRVAIPIHDYEPSYKRVVTQRLVNVIKNHITPKSLFVFSTSVDPAFPAVNYSGSKWGSRFNCLWLLPGNYKSDQAIIKYHTENQMNKVEKYVYKATISDLLKNQPELLVVETRKIKQGFAGKEFDFIKYFSQNQKFRELLSNYQVVHHIEDYALYRKN